jgi:hypothetical protein
MESQLERLGMTPKQYLMTARRYANSSNGRYDPNKLFLSSDTTHKLEYHLPNKIVRFGRVGYADFIIYSFLQKQEFADKKRSAYLSRASKIKGDWKNDPYSPNWLAMRILWKSNV